MSKRAFIVLVALVLAAQFALLAHLVLRWERIVRDGVECRFKCNVYDPRDPFRGRFVRVSVDVPVESGNVTNRIAGGPGRHRGYQGQGCKAFLRLEPKGGTNGLARAAEVADAPRADGVWIGPRDCSWDFRLSWSAKGTNETWDAFSKRQESSGRIWRTRLPGQFFVNEKIAPKADELARGARTNDVVAVYRVLDHKIVIVGIEVNGVPLGEDLPKMPATPPPGRR